jgi:hypothetical protein
MVDTFLVAEKSVVTSNGDGPAVNIEGAAERMFLLDLNITQIIEQESLDVSVWASPDGNDWGQKPLVKFPQKFYRGSHPLLLDMRSEPQIKFLRAHWDVNRWGRGEIQPAFEFDLNLKEVPAEVLASAAAALVNR